MVTTNKPNPNNAQGIAEQNDGVDLLNKTNQPQAQNKTVILTVTS
jgi:hypothetical protein